LFLKKQKSINWFEASKKNWRKDVVKFILNWYYRL
jgi:hypothetical protein